MATLSQVAYARRPATPLALWHLLSLDAPSVATLWSWFVARVNGFALPSGLLVAVFAAVWTLYAADRLLDARELDQSPSRMSGEKLEVRHLFHHRHRSLFQAGIAVAALLLAWLVPRIDPATLRLYAFEGTLLALWFLVLHATRSAHRLPKEFAVGMFFAAAVFVPTVARAPQMRTHLLPAALLLAGLCSLNCLYIYRWEHAAGAAMTSQPPHSTTRIGLQLLGPMSLAACASGFVLMCLGTGAVRELGLTCAACTAMLVALDRGRGRVQPITLRAAADLVLMLPLLYLPLLRVSF